MSATTVGTVDFGPLVLGTNAFGWTADQGTAVAVLDRFVDAGGRAIDTADIYPGMGSPSGSSETIIGNWLHTRGSRDDLVITTKVGMWQERPGLSSANVRAAIEDSLRRLRTDHLDVYYAHVDDPSQTPEQIAQTFGDLVHAGKVGAIGVSNFTPDRLAALSQASTALGTPVAVSQDQYNLLERRFERTLAPILSDLGIAELPYMALASGVLTGKYQTLPSGDSARGRFAAGVAASATAQATVQRLAQVADGHGVGSAAVALAWLRAQATVAVPIAGARNPEQLTPLIESFGLILTAEELAALSAETEH